MLDRLREAPLCSGGLPFAARPALPALITSTGNELRTGTDYDWHGLKRGSAEFCLFQYTLAGRGQLAFAGARHTVQPGQAMLLWFPHDNRYWLAQGDTWRHFYLCLAGREIMRAWQAVVRRHGPLITLDDGSPALAAAAGTCLACLTGRIRDPWSASAQAYGIAMALCAELLGEPAPRPAHPAIAAAKRWAEAHLADGIGAADLARAAGLGRSHFSRLFARCEGVAPARWLTDLRLREAARLLREDALGVAAIAARCGFADPSYFCRAFRREIGVSPGEYRSSGMYGQ